MAEAVYLLCALVSVVCAVMLLNGYRANRTTLLFWSSLCFVGLAVNNVLLFVDLVIVSEVDLSLLRSWVALAAIMALVCGLVWESK
jgi:hypothetical protein